MTNKGDALALAIAISSSEETLLGPSDSELCVIALRRYANEQRGWWLMRRARTPALVCAVLVGACALTYETPVLSAAKGASAKGAIAFGNAAPVPHVWLSSTESNASNALFLDKLPSSIEAQAVTAAADPDDDG
ncbi:hypothetical protein [Bradyrhizobium sp. SZCCHNR1004]|uniref:hypothetical protein n=1 Tax=Bradyrhizobium sp. SZCCHNR1004 TaxID=3057335 RepID=UPI002915DE3A|nr:hypothetical protein [Bradyrhizobium sp. SZCCHNR1004]